MAPHDAHGISRSFLMVLLGGSLIGAVFWACVITALVHLLRG